MNTQVVVIHGGETFDTYDEYLFSLRSAQVNLESLQRRSWKDSLQDTLGGEVDVISPKMPNKANAKYREWKIWFEKYIPFLRDGVVLVGHSLGGIFLAKFLSENMFPKSIKATFLVAAPFDGGGLEQSLADFVLSGHVNMFQQQGGNIFIYHSKDDPVVPFSHCEKYAHHLPHATTVVFEDREHIWQEEFPELVKEVKKLLRE